MKVSSLRVYALVPLGCLTQLLACTFATHTQLPYRFPPFVFPRDDLSTISGDPSAVAVLDRTPGLVSRLKLNVVLGDYAFGVINDVLGLRWDISAARLKSLKVETVRLQRRDAFVQHLRSVKSRSGGRTVELPASERDWFETTCKSCQVYNTCLLYCERDRPMYSHTSWQVSIEERLNWDDLERDSGVQKLCSNYRNPEPREDLAGPRKHSEKECGVYCGFVDLDRTRCRSTVAPVVADALKIWPEMLEIVEALAPVAMLDSEEGDQLERLCDEVALSFEREGEEIYEVLRSLSETQRAMLGAQLANPIGFSRSGVQVLKEAIVNYRIFLKTTHQYISTPMPL